MIPMWGSICPDLIVLIVLQLEFAFYCSSFIVTPMSVALLDTNPCLFTLPNLKCAKNENFDVAVGWGTVHQTGQAEL